MPEDKDYLDELQPDGLMPGDEDFDEEEYEGEEEPEEAEAEEREPGRGRRFFRRGEKAPAEEQPALGSVRGAHERVRVDDRASAVFAIVCAIGLVGILVAAVLSPYLPSIGPGPAPLPTLNLETFFVPTTSPGASLSPAPSPTVTPTP